LKQDQTTNTQQEHKTCQTMMTVQERSESYGKYFCDNHETRVKNLIWDLKNGNTMSDPLYIKVYNGSQKKVEPVQMKTLLDHIAANGNSFENEEKNHALQMNLYGDVWINQQIYYMLKEFWEENDENNNYMDSLKKEEDEVEDEEENKVEETLEEGEDEYCETEDDEESEMDEYEEREKSYEYDPYGHFYYNYCWQNAYTNYNSFYPTPYMGGWLMPIIT